MLKKCLRGKDYTDLEFFFLKHSDLELSEFSHEQIIINLLYVFYIYI